MLELVETRSVVLPPGFAVLGGAYGADGSVLFWGDHDLWDVAPLEDHAKRICPGIALAPRYVSFGPRRGRLEVYDSLSRRVLALNRSRCTVETIWQAASDSSIVGRGGRDWIEIRLLRAGTLSLRKSGAGGASVHSLRRQEPVRLGTSLDYVLSSTAQDALITEIGFPYRTLRVDSAEPIAVFLDPTTQLTAGERAEVLTGWQSLHIVALGSAFVQVLADPRSDRRLILIMDASGRIIRSTIIDAAIGILDVDPRNQRLVALRDVGQRELVYYRWHWRSDHQTSIP